MVLATSLVGMGFAQGVRLAFGAFLPAWESDLGQPRALLAGIAGAVYVIYGLGQPVAGRLADRLGARPVFASGLLLVAAGAALSSFASGPVGLAVGFAGIGGLGYAATSSALPASLVVRWFASHRGLALGLTAMAVAIGQMVLTPIGLFAIEAVGWRATMLSFALVLFALAPLAWLLIRSSPEALGLRPFGEARTKGAHFVMRGPERVASGVFALIVVPYFVCGMATSGLVAIHLVPLAHDHGIPTVVIATAVGVVGIANIGGALASGWLSDRFSRGTLLALVYAVRAASLLLLLNLTSSLLLIVFAAVFSLVDFASLSPTQSLTAEYFGPKHGTATVIGVLSLGHQLGAATGAVAAGAVRQLTGTYDAMVILTIVASLAGAACCLALPKERRRPVGPAAVPDL